jgi:hypothetical protein
MAAVFKTLAVAAAAVGIQCGREKKEEREERER